ncbi:acyl-CoA dehydrogenase family protein [Streptomyces monticola]|uniref:Acyl-CoA dehydrogenase family protein n=1 Tax=Streptomyces monticola TaxID=2666263 RepID=A0ABW2JKL5_9ACTN
MDFTPTEEQAAARDLAEQIFADLSTPDRLSAAGTDMDAQLWKALGAAGLIGAVEDIGLLGLVLLLEEQGRRTAQVPFAASCVYGLLAVGAHGTPEQRERLLPGLRDGTSVATGALRDPAAVRAVAAEGQAAVERGPEGQGPAGAVGDAGAEGQGPAGAVGRASGGQVPPGGAGRLSGTVAWVPWLREATHVLVAAADHSLWMVRAADAEVVPVELTAPWSAGRLILDGTPGERIGGAGIGEAGIGEAGAGGAGTGGAGTGGAGTGGVGTGGAGTGGGGAGVGGGGAGGSEPGTEPYRDVLAMARTAFAGLQAGVCAGSLARAVEYTSVREQFGKPLAAKQAVLLRAADAYMDTEAIRVTAYEAAWRRDEGLAYQEAALTTAWWASEAGRRVVHAGQHLHGGMGADLDHPVHRHFLWGRQLDAYLGCGAEVLAELGQLIAEEGERV